VIASPAPIAAGRRRLTRLQRDGVYTPQVMVKGRVEGTGVDANELTALVRSAERGDRPRSVDFADGAVTVGGGSSRS
jgi:hypothetical protein